MNKYFALYEGDILVNVAYAPSGLPPHTKKSCGKEPINEREFLKLREELSEKLTKSYRI